MARKAGGRDGPANPAARVRAWRASTGRHADEGQKACLHGWFKRAGQSTRRYAAAWAAALAPAMRPQVMALEMVKPMNAELQLVSPAQ